MAVAGGPFGRGPTLNAAEPSTALLDVPAGPVHVRIFPGAHVGPDAPVLFCLHGLTDSGLIYETLWEFLGREWTVVAPDLPGHGLTPWTASRTYDLVEPVEALAHVLDRLPELVGSGRVVLLAHSVAVVTAVALAARRPERVAHLILEEPPRRPVFARYAQRHEQVWLDRLQRLGHEERMGLPMDNQGWRSEDLDAWSRSKEGVDRRMFDGRIGWGERVPTLLRRVGMPVTLILGQVGRGSITRGWGLRRLQGALGGRAELFRLPAGHNPRRDASADYVPIVRDVLQRCVVAAHPGGVDAT